MQLGKLLGTRIFGHFEHLNTKKGQAPDKDQDPLGWAMLEAARLL